MSDYPAGAAILAEASLKLDRLRQDQGVVLVEGEDDRRCLGDRVIPELQMVVADGKCRLLAAFEDCTDEEKTRFVFLADCDFDVPAGRLAAGHGLILTRNPSLETDVVEAGGVQPVVEELVPRGKWRSGDKDATVRYVVEQAVELAEGVGKIRLAARRLGIALELERLRDGLKKYRRDGSADIEKMVRVVNAQADQPPFAPDRLLAEVATLPGGLRMCDGHDLLAAIAVVLKEDFRLRQHDISYLPQLLRVATDRALVMRCEYGRRLSRWEAQHGARVLAP